MMLLMFTAAGVTYVHNDIKVWSEVAPGNEELRTCVSTALLTNPYIERFDRTVSASQGPVYLSGHVYTTWEKILAKRPTEGVRGAVAVVNNTSCEYEGLWKTDPQIRRDVKDQLWWSPSVDKDDVIVSVKKGIVTLTGTVDTYSEHQRAEDNAYEGGAKKVVNNLVVRYPYYGPYGHVFNWPYFYRP
jgi:osmotically-inducible protein OsmY